MHGLVNKSIQCFVQDNYGQVVWIEIARQIGIEVSGFESMLTYEDALTNALIEAASCLLDKPEDMFLEDVGTYLVSHPNTEAIRRLLRFGGQTFSEFLLSLDDLPDRVRLAVPDLLLPNLELLGGEDGQFELRVGGPEPRYACVLVGILRAMADDFGALAFLEQESTTGNGPTIRISLLDSAFSEGRSFSLARPTANAPEPQA
ncbi:heme NO-binding domain-containing protein [Aliiruegeria lutimaris]|uniref:Haem-NO-binding n=1 Tax=Aliiruegeria lutimaris TaxID=571298 RepID=A0A1G8X364_9RHOB|nr:heme NO-binding domain-containing protein [Aliiruegeria lutimaris]SDJ85099.1 Haem-NO-binding [Aliiruegeria lutimaris]